MHPRMWNRLNHKKWPPYDWCLEIEFIKSESHIYFSCLLIEGNICCRAKAIKTDSCWCIPIPVLPALPDNQTPPVLPYASLPPLPSPPIQLLLWTNYGGKPDVFSWHSTPYMQSEYTWRKQPLIKYRWTRTKKLLLEHRMVNLIFGEGEIQFANLPICRLDNGTTGIQDKISSSSHWDDTLISILVINLCSFNEKNWVNVKAKNAANLWW